MALVKPLTINTATGQVQRLQPSDTIAGTFRTFDTAASAEAVTGADNDICFIAETDAFYRYEASGSAYTRDGVYILNTADGGNTRWLAVAGKHIFDNLNVKGDVISNGVNLTDNSHSHSNKSYLDTIDQGLASTDSVIFDRVYTTNYIRTDSDLYVGKNSGGDSRIFFYDDNSNDWRYMMWDDSEDDWRIEDNTGTARTIYHSGNHPSQHSNYTYLNNIDQYLGTSQSPNWRGLTLQNATHTDTVLRVMGGSTNYDATLELMETTTLGAKIHYNGTDNNLHFYGHYSGSDNEVAWYPREGGKWAFPVLVELERSGVSHGFTGITDSNNFAYFDIYENNYGGLNISTFVEDSSVGNMHFVSEHHDGHVYPTRSQSPSSSTKGVFTFAGHKRSGTGRTSLSSGDALFVLRNHTATTFITTAQGAVYNDVNVYSYFDDEDDIQLIETVRNSIAEKPVIDRYRNRLEELDIIQNGFMNMGGAIALNMGGIGQLWNMIRELANNLGVSDAELLSWAKKYN